MHTYLACFDISDDAVRRSISRILESHGRRVQYSVFEISVKDRKALDDLRKKLAEDIEEEDDIRFYHLCARCRAQSCDANNQPIARFEAAIVL